MTLEERHRLIEPLMNQERIRLAQSVLGNVRPATDAEWAVFRAARKALDELYLMMDVRQ